MIITELLPLCKSGLYAFINESKKKVDVYYSSNMLNSIVRHITQISMDCHSVRGLILDKSELDLVFLEELSDPTLLKLKQSHWVKYYEELGYTNYRTRTALEYKVKIRDVGELLHVILESRSKKQITVGIFDSIQDASSFVDKYYSSPNFLIVYSTNQLTQSYIQADI